MINDIFGQLKIGTQPIRKPLVKCGTIKKGVVEATPIVWEGKLLRFEWMRSSSWGIGNESRKEGYYHFVDMANEEEIGAAFAYSHSFGCAYAENGIMYVHGVNGNNGGTNIIDVCTSSDLVNWDIKTAIVLPEELHIFNTSVCKGDGRYIMTIEVSGPKEMIGVPFTILFAESKDLLSWTLLPMDEHIYLSEKYTACPSIRYFDGFYYMVYLEALPFYRYAPYIVRSKDLKDFEVGIVNPFIMFDDGDKKIASPNALSEEEKKALVNAVNCNDSDIDFCEYNGKTIVLYSWGNQRGTEFLAKAEYDGGLEEFLTSFFE